MPISLTSESICNQNLSLYSAAPVSASSLGYAEYILNRYNTEFLENKGEITRNKLKNSDFREIHLKLGDKRFTAALVYGFRNIKSLLANKKALAKYQYIEIMACPGGCVNGGGQMRMREGVTSREVLADIEKEIDATFSGVSPQRSKSIETLLAESTAFSVKYKNIENDLMTNLKW